MKIKLICILLYFSFSLYGTYEISICSIFKNESQFLKEWIEFHRIQGVEHFYLYNNDSSDNYLDVLKIYIAENIVTLIDWPYVFAEGDTEKWSDIQTGAYNHCMCNFGDHSKWIAVIDIDEFLFSPNALKLTDLLVNYEKFGGLCVNWRLFGTSSIEDIPPGTLLIEGLIRWGTSSHEHMRNIKSIVQPKKVESCCSSHHFKFKMGFFAVDSNYNRIDGKIASCIDCNTICINHYWTRTEKYFREKKIQRRMSFFKDDASEKLFNYAKEMNALENKEILQFVKELKKRMSCHISP